MINNLAKTFFIILLALGLLGIILGILIGLYRNDLLEGMQTNTGAEEETTNWNDELGKQKSEPQTTDEKRNVIFDMLVQGRLHTSLLASGTLMIIISIIMFLLNVKKNFE